MSAGAFWRPLVETLNYEATIPIKYTMAWFKPQTNSTGTSKQCSGDHNCELATAMHQLMEAVDGELEPQESEEGWQLFEDQQHREKRSLDFLGEGLAWCCGVATQHKLDSLHMEERALQKKLRQLEGGLSENIKTLSQNSVEFKKYTDQVGEAFKSTERRIKEMEKAITNFRNKTNEWEGFFGTLIENQFQNTRRIVTMWRALEQRDVKLSCRQHQIPEKVLRPQLFQANLMELQKELIKAGHDLAIAVTDIHRYYQLPITDCVISGNNITLVVRVPIVQQGIRWSLFELITAPFSWYNQSCRIEYSTLFLAVAEAPYTRHRRHNLYRQISGLGLHQCRPHSDKLCFLPRFGEDKLHGPTCARKLYEGATVEELSYHCPMKCHASTSLTITEVEEDLFIITNLKVGAYISCPSSNKTLTEFGSLLGALKIKLHCQCALVYLHDVIIPRRFPCLDTIPRIHVNHIIPAAWSNLKSFILNPIHTHSLPSYNNFSECINPNWSLTIPHLNLTSPNKLLQNFVANIPESPQIFSFADSYGVHTSATLVVWNLILTVLLIYIFWKSNHPAIASPNQTCNPTTSLLLQGGEAVRITVDDAS